MKSFTVKECQCRLWHGLIPAVPVPFTATREIDTSAQDRLIAYLASQPIAAVAVWAHTGRGLLLSREQRLQVLRSWSQGLGEGKLVVAGVGGSPEKTSDASAYISSALEMAQDARENGAHILMIHPPTAFRDAPDSEDRIFDFHRQLAEAGTPLILFYLYEAAGGISYSHRLLRRLFALPEVLGIKLATLDSVMTFQDVANLISREFPLELLITGEDRFLGYSLMCGAQAALIGMGAGCTGYQYKMMKAYYDGQATGFQELSRGVDRLSQVLFTPPMEGYIRRMLWLLVHEGIIPRQSAEDPWGPKLPESEFVELGNTLRALGEIPTEPVGQG